MSDTEVTRRGSGAEKIKEGVCFWREGEVVKREINMTRGKFDKTKAISLFFKSKKLNYDNSLYLKMTHQLRNFEGKNCKHVYQEILRAET